MTKYIVALFLLLLANTLTVVSVNHFGKGQTVEVPRIKAEEPIKYSEKAPSIFKSFMLFTDPKTCVEYLVSNRNDSITPRFDSNGELVLDDVCIMMQYDIPSIPKKDSAE